MAFGCRSSPRLPTLPSGAILAVARAATGGHPGGHGAFGGPAGGGVDLHGRLLGSNAAAGGGAPYGGVPAGGGAPYGGYPGSGWNPSAWSHSIEEGGRGRRRAGGRTREGPQAAAPRAVGPQLSDRWRWRCCCAALSSLPWGVAGIASAAPRAVVLPRPGPPHVLHPRQRRRESAPSAPRRCAAPVVPFQPAGRNPNRAAAAPHWCHVPGSGLGRPSGYGLGTGRAAQEQALGAGATAFAPPFGCCPSAGRGKGGAARGARVNLGGELCAR
ncbi:hypothetical protein PLESTB_000046600 [Pleodorina starrii]|uniref:Uncharacterized protein n=1 Tax=Pleodorina starrii TaxID=330485 RepID=A0A9W6EX77_9CHLO|nr:hypothetical protein PLESTB_000046600 [Pleodorina starrii]